MSRKSINKWTPELISEYAKLFSTRVSFAREAQGAYQAARKFGILDEVCAHMRQRKWTRETLSKEALRFANRSDFARESPAAYKMAHRRGLIDEICQHAPKRLNEWDQASIMGEALQYSSQEDFRKNSKAYYAAADRGILKEVQAHMTKGRRKPTDADMFYIIWDAVSEGGKHLVKFGITSHRSGTKRLAAHARFFFQKPHMAALIMAKNARLIEQFFLKNYTERPDISFGDGVTELRMVPAENLKALYRTAYKMCEV